MKHILHTIAICIVISAVAAFIAHLVTRSEAQKPVPNAALIGQMDGANLYYFLDNENGNVVYIVRTKSGSVSVSSQPMQTNE